MSNKFGMTEAEIKQQQNKMAWEKDSIQILSKEEMEKLLKKEEKK